MNALYVTVSIPLLLVLAGFNHAHGLTTFGKTNQGTQQPQKPIGTDLSDTVFEKWWSFARINDSWIGITSSAFIMSIWFLFFIFWFSAFFLLVLFFAYFFKSLNTVLKSFTVTGKPCTSQTNCQLIKGTTCLKDRCVCGNNEYPVNGNCTNVLKGESFYIVKWVM